MKTTSVDSSSPVSARGRSGIKGKDAVLVKAALDSSEAGNSRARKVTSRTTLTPAPMPVAPVPSPNLEEVRQMIATAAYYRALLSPAERLALVGQSSELAAIVQRIALAPPDQPPRAD